MLTEKKRIYSDEQLLHMYSNFKAIHLKLLEVFEQIALREEGIALHEINDAIEVKAFVRDKCIAALELPGLIYKDGVGTQKICKLTKDGERLKELLNMRRG